MPADAIAIVGATGAVGREALAILLARGIPASRLRALASARSAGESIDYGTERLRITTADDADFTGCGLALFCTDADTSRRLAPRALTAGATVIDNSSAFRMDPGVPLIVPEINGALLHADVGPTVRRGSSGPSLTVGLPNERSAVARRVPTPCLTPSAATPRARLIANPNCSTIILLCAIEPLRREFGVGAIDLATYQAVSGAGVVAIEELLTQTRDVLEGREPTPRVFAEPCAFNLFSHDSPVNTRDGVNGEERKIIDESRKILSQPTLRLTPTCVRVPALRAHTQAITVTLDRPATESQVRDAIARHSDSVGLALLDDRAANSFPTPRKATGGDRVLIGRLRPDPCETPHNASDAHHNSPSTHRTSASSTPAAADPAPAYRRWCLLASGDQIRKGAALNAIQIADRLGLTAPAPALNQHIQRADHATLASTEPPAQAVGHRPILQSV